MNKPQNISVIGDGGWGTTLAVYLTKKHYSVKLWMYCTHDHTKWLAKIFELFLAREFMRFAWLKIATYYRISQRIRLKSLILQYYRAWLCCSFRSDLVS